MISVKARLTLKPTQEGGRYSGVVTRYSPNHAFEYNRKGNPVIFYIGEITFDKEWILPGETEVVTVTFWASWSSMEQYLKLGRKWGIYEGFKCVGEAEVLEV